MNLSSRSEFALLSLIHVTRQTDTPTSSSIGVSVQIPSEMLHDILITLVNARYLRLIKGHFYLAKAAEKIPVINVIRLFDDASEPLEPVIEKIIHRGSPIEKEEKLAGLFREDREQFVDRLGRVTLADLI